MVEPMHLHLMLLQLIAAEDDDLFRLLFFKEGLRKFLSKGTCAAGNENDFIFPVHDCSLFQRVVE